MNIRYAIAALLCAFMIGDSRAVMTVDGEQCVIPDASYVHVGVMNDTDRFYWMWCVTKFGRYWSVILDPTDRVRDFTFDVGDAKKQQELTFRITNPKIDRGEPATAELERAATNAAANDTHRPPVPQWRVQTNGTSKTRPGYAISDGKRSTTAAAERVPVGVACDCRDKAGRAIEGKSTYCVVPGTATPLLGALCTPGEPNAPKPPEPPPVLTPPIVTPPVIVPPATGPGATPPTNGAGSKKSVSL